MLSAQSDLTCSSSSRCVQFSFESVNIEVIMSNMIVTLKLIPYDCSPCMALDHVKCASPHSQAYNLKLYHVFK